MGNALLDRCVKRDMRTWCRSGFYCRWSVVPSEISQALAGAADVVFGSAPDLGWAAVAAPAAGLGFPAASCLPLRGPGWSSRRPPLASSSARRRTFGLGCSGRAGLVSTARRLTSLARPLRGAAARGGSATPLRYQHCGIQKRSRPQRSCRSRDGLMRPTEVRDLMQTWIPIQRAQTSQKKLHTRPRATAVAHGIVHPTSRNM